MAKSPKTGRLRPGLTARFALASLAAFLAIGLGLSFIITKQLIGQEESSARFHARFVANSVLRYALGRDDVGLPFTGSRYVRLDRFVRERILEPPVLRLKIWSPGGILLYSDAPELVGRTFPGNPPPRTVDHGAVIGGVADLSQPEDRSERALSRELYSTYVPLYLGGRTPGAPPDAVVEVYQDYGAIQLLATDASRTWLLTLGGGLLILYVLLLPIAFRASRAQRRQNDQLEEQAKRLSTLLAREQATVVELRKLSQMKSDFVAVASHELRSPLTAILGYVKTLRRPEFENDETARREFLAAMERQGDRLLRLVTNLLTTRQLENREGAEGITRFAFLTLAEEVREGFHDRRGRIRLEIPEGVPEIETDRVHVGEILGNLVDNALKYSPDDSVVEIGADAPGNILRFWVRDAGVGIPPPDLERVFDRFYQSDQSATRRFGGVGLGLHVVKELTESLGGRISVDSIPAVGSTFTVILPLRPAARQDVTRFSSVKQAASSSPT